MLILFYFKHTGRYFYERKDVRLSETIQNYREEVMHISEIIKARHYKRMHGADGRLTSTTIFADIFYTQERLIDYCDIVADSLIKYNKSVTGSSAKTGEDNSKAKQHIHALFQDKYEMLNIGEDEKGRMVDLMDK